MLGVLAVTAAASVLVLLLSGPILAIWLGSAVSLPVALQVGLAVWAVLSATFNAAAMLFNAAGELRFQVTVATIMAVTSIVASIILGRSFGVAGVIWGTVIAYTACSAVPQLVRLRTLVRSLRDRP